MSSLPLAATAPAARPPDEDASRNERDRGASHVDISPSTREPAAELTDGTAAAGRTDAAPIMAPMLSPVSGADGLSGSPTTSSQSTGEDAEKAREREEQARFAEQVSRSLRQRTRKGRGEGEPKVTGGSNLGRQATAHSLHVHMAPSEGEREKQDGDAPERHPSGKDKSNSKSPSHRLAEILRPYWIWIPPNLNWPKLKPVLRSALVAWVCLVLFVIQPVQEAMGTASFLILIGAFIQPADAPFATCIERELFLLLFLCITWAYSCIALAIAHSVREVKLTQSEAVFDYIYQGRYVETRPAIVCAFFLAFGSSVLIWLKIHFGPSPFLFATVLSLIALDIMLTYGPLYPFPFYMLGKAFVVPLAIKSAVTIFFSLVFFPKSTNSQFVERITAILRPITQAMVDQRELLKKSPLDEEFDFQLVHNLLNKAEAGLAPLQMSSRLLKRELSFGVASGSDLQKLEILTRKLLPSCDGLAYYLALISADMKHEHFPRTPGAESRVTTPHASRPGTPMASRPPTRPPSPHRTESSSPASEAVAQPTSKAPSRPTASRRMSSQTGEAHDSSSSLHHGRGRDHQQHSLLQSILHGRGAHGRHTPDSASNRFSFAPRHEHAPVGTWESLRYAEVETHLHPTANDGYSEQMMRLIGESSGPLLQANADALNVMIAWFERINHERLRDFVDRVFDPRAGRRKREEQASIISEAITALQAKIDAFDNKERMHLLTPFFQDGEQLTLDAVPHRYLYQAFVHQFHLLETARAILALLVEAKRICDERKLGRVWFPTAPRLFHVDAWREMGTGVEEEDPRDTRGASLSTLVDLGESKSRDPDALEPETMAQEIGHRIALVFSGLFSGTSVFMMKGAALTALVSLPSYLRSSAEFAYVNRALWSLFLAQIVCPLC